MSLSLYVLHVFYMETSNNSFVAYRFWGSMKIEKCRKNFLRLSGAMVIWTARTEVMSLVNIATLRKPKTISSVAPAMFYYLSLNSAMTMMIVLVTNLINIYIPVRAKLAL